MNRRHFLQTAAATAAVASTSTLSVPAAPAEKSGLPWKFCTFTKSLQHLGYDELAEKIAAIGFDGIEAPIRPGGHIEPAAVEDELPKMAEALKKCGLEITVMTSGINEVSEEQRTEAALKTAADLGIERFRMAYYKYNLAEPIPPQLDEMRPKLKDLVALSSEIGIKPVYQNHSGKNYVGAPVWDLQELIKDMDPAEVGIAFDIGHATIEGSKCWPLHWAVAKPWIDTVYVKEPHWGENQRPKVGPLGEGGVDKGFYQTLKSSDFAGPISLHVEYFNHRDPSNEPAFLEAVATDFATLKGFLDD